MFSAESHEATRDNARIPNEGALTAPSVALDRKHTCVAQRMWINTDVELPDEILKVQSDGTLVLFAGAGVSMGPPSDLPSFKGLAEAIASDAVDPLPEEPLDRFLGRCEQRGVRVQERACTLLDRKTSTPTVLHRELVAMFGTAERVRIVTTNFDRHFTTVASELFGASPFPIYVGPALPLGRDAPGLIYLHGSLDAPHHPLILTDADFGRAYLMDGWATRFLVELFQRYTVCFVGYSHSDPPMYYLGRSLLPGPRRFAFTTKDRDAEWLELGITPIHYPRRDGGNPHSALTESVQAWRKRTTMGVLDHAFRIRELVSTAPPIERDHVDYLRSAIANAETCQYFVAHAVGPPWLTFAADAGALDQLFTVDQRGAHNFTPLASWLAERFMLEHPSELLALLQSREMHIGQHLWWEFGRRLALVNPRPSPELRFRWLTFLTLTRHAHWSTHWLEEILQTLGQEDDLPAALLLFAHLLEPAPRSESRWPRSGIAPGAPRLPVELRTTGDPEALREAWSGVLLPLLSRCHRTVAPLITAALTRAHLLEQGAGAGSHEEDRTSIGRSAIEPHRQDRHPDPLDLIIDAARDLLEFLLREHRQEGYALRSSWENSDVPILRRLAFHGYTEDPDLDPEATLELILVRGWLDDSASQHEVFRLLARVYSAANESARTSFLDRISIKDEGSLEHDVDADPERTTAYARYNLVVWLSRAAPNSAVTTERLRKLQDEYPDFSPRKHPDLSRWFSGVYTIRPISPKDATSLLSEPPAAQLEWIISFKEEVPEPETPNRDGLLQAIQEAVSSSFDWGWELSEALLARGGDDRGLWAAILRGWTAKGLTHEYWQKVLGLILKYPSVEQAAGRSVVEILQRAIEDESGVVDAPMRRMLVDVAERIIGSPGQSDGLAIQEKPDWLTLALNHSAGHAMLVWLHALSKDRADAREAWQRLDDAMRSRLQSVLQQEGVSGDRARTIAASQTQFLFMLDPDWCRDRLLPLFDWDKNVATAAQAWQGYLQWGRTNEPLFAAMRPSFEKTYRHLGSELGEARLIFNHWLADIATHFTEDPWRQGWLRRYVAEAPLDCREEWTRRVAHNLRESPPEAAATLWRGWLAAYWDDRLSGVPRPIEQSEGREMVNWVFGLSAVVPEVVARVERTPMTLPEHNSAYKELQDSSLVEHSPVETARLLRALLRSTERLSWGCEMVDGVVRTLITVGTDRAILRDVCERMAQLQCPSATELGTLLASQGT